MVFDRLYTLWVRERKDVALIPLDDDFFERVQTYLRHLETMSHEDPDPLIQQLFQQRFARVNYLINDLISIRLEKQFLAALAGDSLSEQLPKEEEQTFEELNRVLSRHRKKVLGIPVDDTADPAPDPLAETVEGQLWAVYFTANDPEPFLGADLLTYGPFIAGEIVYLPAENARQLVLQNKVKVLDI